MERGQPCQKHMWSIEWDNEWRLPLGRERVTPSSECEQVSKPQSPQLQFWCALHCRTCVQRCDFWLGIVVRHTLVCFLHIQGIGTIVCGRIAPNTPLTLISNVSWGYTRQLGRDVSYQSCHSFAMSLAPFCGRSCQHVHPVFMSK